MFVGKISKNTHRSGIQNSYLFKKYSASKASKKWYCSAFKLLELITAMRKNVAQYPFKIVPINIINFKSTADKSTNKKHYSIVVYY